MYYNADIPTVAAAGFNMVIGGVDDFSRPDLKIWNTAYLQQAEEYGVGVWFHVCNLFRDGQENYDGLAYLVNTFKDYPGLAGWYLADEPGAGMAERLTNAYNIIKLLDQNHPVIGLDNTPSEFGTYAPIFDTFLSDPYPYYTGSLNSVSQWINSSMAYKGMGNCKSIMVCEQAFDSSLTQNQIWNMAYQGIVAGVNGMAWYSYATAVTDGIWGEYQPLAAALNQVMPYTVFSTSRTDYSTADTLWTAVFDGPSGKVLVAVNVTTSTQTKNIPVSVSTITAVGPLRSATATKNGATIDLSIGSQGCGAWRLQ
jgi:hypothetical protein